MARAIDELSMIRWLNSRDGAEGVNRPTLLSELFDDHEPDDEEGYDTPEEFMREYYGK